MQKVLAFETSKNNSHNVMQQPWLADSCCTISFFVVQSVTHDILAALFVEFRSQRHIRRCALDVVHSVLASKTQTLIHVVG